MPFLIFEGGEGSGKGTQIALLNKKLDPNRTVFTREPGGTLFGEQVRAIVLGTPMEIETEMLLFLAARSELVRKVIRPALDAGKLVVSDRFGLSTIAYQIYGRERPDLFSMLKDISKYVLGDLETPYAIFLDVPPEAGIGRVKSRGDGMTRFDAEKQAFHERVRQGYLAHYNDNGRGACIDASASIDEVAKQIDAQMHRWGLLPNPA